MREITMIKSITSQESKQKTISYREEPGDAGQ